MIEPAQIKIIKGNPTDEEVAAVIAALTTQTNHPSPASTPRHQGGWSAYWRTLRTPVHPAPNAWRTSLRGF